MAAKTQGLDAAERAEQDALQVRLDAAAYLLHAAANHLAKGRTPNAVKLIDAAVLHAQYAADALERALPSEVA